MSEQDPSKLRISDEERHQVAEVLRQAAGDGRIDFEELDERLEATYAAKTYADLLPITHDLPPTSNLVPPVPTTPATVGGQALVVNGPARQNHLAIMSGVDRRGHWVVPQSMNVLAFMGGANLDMREAQFAAREVVLTITAIMGGADIVVPPDVNVVVEGIGIMGGFAGPSSRVPAELTAGSPTVRIRGLAFWGGVNVHRRHRRNPEAPKPRGHLGH